MEHPHRVSKNFVSAANDSRWCQYCDWLTARVKPHSTIWRLIWSSNLIRLTIRVRIVREVRVFILNGPIWRPAPWLIASKMIYFVQLNIRIVFQKNLSASRMTPADISIAIDWLRASNQIRPFGDQFQSQISSDSRSVHELCEKWGFLLSMDQFGDLPRDWLRPKWFILFNWTSASCFKKFCQHREWLTLTSVLRPIGCAR
jgi:hypothetical protein